MNVQPFPPPKVRRGRPFSKGNPGRKPGSRNRTTLVADALLRNEEEALVRKAIEMAKAGDGPMLKFLLERLLPRERCVQIDLPPMDGVFDAVNALGRIVETVGQGQIAPSEAEAFVSMIGAYARIVDAAEFGERLDNIERELRASNRTKP